MGSFFYDILLFLLTACTCFGEFGGALQIDRALAILFLPLLFLVIREKGCGYVRNIVVIFSLFYLFCIVSVAWTPDLTEAVKELFYYPVHFALFLEIIAFARYARNPQKSIVSGWLVAVLLCSVVAAWEMMTGNHLSVAKEQADEYNTGAAVLEHFTASVTFGNYNSFVTFLCYSMPWLFWILMKKEKSFWSMSMTVVAIVSAFLFTLLNASRGGLISQLVMFFIVLVSSPMTKLKYLLCAISLLLVGYVLITYGEILTAVMEARLADGGMFDGESRYTIWANALNTFWRSWGLGVGIGGMNEAMGQWADGEITVTHNIFLELLLQYGLVFFFVFVLAICKLFRSSLLVSDKRSKVAVLMALLCMPIYGIIDSTYLLKPQLYVLFATIYVFVNSEQIKCHHQVLLKTS